MAMELSKNPTVLVVNDNVFAHGGLLPEHGRYSSSCVMLSNWCVQSGLSGSSPLKFRLR